MTIKQLRTLKDILAGIIVILLAIGTSALMYWIEQLAKHAAGSCGTPG